ncbi:MAG TPA: C39 family peptidase [Leptolyngbyaceae cyanobacterium M33_DOE_097]|uniref:Peptidase C39-like domain-containing protein n=1 Tax=Oscillatoriales cyanobacterium SpSt-418 TaxID=2282169 RepID=A0A7C3PH67_9CYAN|nr:C39 family peptidase [Leptolyngbyaceae cyanobacterium M33_DOE_097]
MSNLSISATDTAVSYGGPWEVLLNQPVTLRGSFDPQRVVNISLRAEDKFPLMVTPNYKDGTWAVSLERGMTMAGARWLRLTGADGNGKIVDDEIVYITVSTDPLTVGQDLSLRVLEETVFKSDVIDSSRLNDQQKVKLTAGQVLSVRRYGYVDGHLKLELEKPIPPLGNFGYVFEPFVQLSKGSQILIFDLGDIPNTPLSAYLLVTQTTLLKTKPADSANLPANQVKEVLEGESFQVTGYACIGGHFRVKLAQPIAGLGDSVYVYWKHVVLKKENKLIPFDPEALTATALRTTLLKKRPVDSSQLKPEDVTNFPAGTVYGVQSYALEAGHIKIALTEEIAKFGNTGYVFAPFVQMKRGSQAFNPFPPQVELAVPYFSQRDNPNYSWATCNVTSIAMIFYYYGVRSKNPRQQLEDELLRWVINRYGPGSQTVHSYLSQLIRAYGFETSFSTTRSWASVKDELIARRPVVLSGDFTASGHIVTLIGYTPQGYLVNDPWGNALGGYVNTEGRKLLYPYSYMDRVAGPDGGVWAHFISPK